MTDIDTCKSNMNDKCQNPTYRQSDKYCVQKRVYHGDVCGAYSDSYTESWIIPNLQKKPLIHQLFIKRFGITFSYF